MEEPSSDSESSDNSSSPSVNDVHKKLETGREPDKAVSNPINDAARKHQLEADSDFFKSFIDLVPARTFFDADTKRKIRQEDSDSMEDEDEPQSRKKTPKRKNSFQNDPLQEKTVSQLQGDLAAINEEGKKNSNKVVPKKTKNKKRKKKSSKVEDPISTEALREKLHARMQELRGKSGKLSAEEVQEHKRLRRREKKMGKQKSKMKKNNKGQKSDEHVMNGSSLKVIPMSQKPVFNKEGKMVFSKFDFTDAGEKDNPKSEFKGKDYKRLLEKVEKRKEKVIKLREKDDVAADRFEEKISWQTALNKAQGAKVKDNPELLKKAAKRKEKMKLKKQKKWQDRQNTVKEKIEEKQKKRAVNISTKKEAKRDKKRKRFIKKGRIVPGF